MKKFFASFLVLSATVTVAQVTKPTDFDKKLKDMITNYEAAYNVLANSSSPDAEKKKAIVIVKNSFESNGVFLFDGVEYAKTQKEDFIKMGEVFKNIETFFSLGHKIAFNTASSQVGVIEKNFLRNSLTAEVKVQQKLTYKIEKTIQDSIKVDTITMDTTVFSHKDTVTESKLIPLSFVFKFDIESNTLINPLIEAVSKVGLPHKFKPLSGDDKWWVELDKSWKTYFITKLKMPELPDKYDFGKLEYIEKIDLTGTDFADFSPLNRLKGLKSLNFSKSNFSAIESLKGLTQLKELDLSETKITDIKPLAELTQLEILKLNRLNLESLQGIEKMQKLIELEVIENKLLDIEPVKYLTKLERIDFSLNLEITTIQPLAGLQNLTKVKFAKMKVKDLSPLANCPNLVELDFFNNQISSLTPISKCYKITSINLGYNKITTLDELAGMKYIVELFMKGSAVADISVCSNFRHLQNVDLSETYVTDLSPLFGAERILVLTLVSSKVSVGEKDRFKKRFPECRLTYY